MGASTTRVLTGRRPRWRAYLLLARVSNLPTVWTNVLAGTIVARVPFDWPRFLQLSAAVSLLYMGGMFLNDAFDRDVDASQHPGRPLPSGDVAMGEAFASGFGLLAAGELVLVSQRPSAAALAWGLLLAAAIVYYDYRHKENTYGPAVMGLCRGLVYCVAATAAGAVSFFPVIGSAAVLTGYVIGLTWVAKRAGPSGGWLVGVLLAGISLVDAALVAFYGPSSLAWLAASGFVLTLLLQRLVPGT